MAEPKVSASGIQETFGNLAKQIARTQKISFPDDDDSLKYWFRPPPPPPVDLSKPAKPTKAEKVKTGEISFTDTMDSLPPELLASTPTDEQVIVQAISPDSNRPRTHTPPGVPGMYDALIVTKAEDGQASHSIQQVPMCDLQEGELLVRVDYSSVNYTDALAISGHPGVAGKFPLTPGIDASGVVAQSASPVYSPGDEIVAMGFDLGMYVDGGFGRFIRVPADWVIRCPSSMSMRQVMTYGTEGLAAALARNELERSGVSPRSGEILVTGATGGIGVMAVALLAQAGFQIVAAAEDISNKGFLMDLGAAEVIAHADLTGRKSRKPLHDSRWAGVIDPVGGDLLTIALKEAQYGAAVICCGMVGGTEVTTSVYPFIMRSIRLIGIDATYCPIPLRNRIWRLLSTDWCLEGLDFLTKECTLAGVDEAVESILCGGSEGRYVVKHG